MSAGHFALASCTRFSPNTRWPAAITGTIASGPKVLLTATRVTGRAGRPCARPLRSTASRVVCRTSISMSAHGHAACDQACPPAQVLVLHRPMTTERYNPARGGAAMAGRLARAEAFRAERGPGPAEILRPRDVPLSVGPHPHGPRAQLHHGRRDRPLSCAPAASTCCTRWAGTPSACRPRTPPSSAACIPKSWTYDNIATMRRQLKRMGLSLDWSREIATCDPAYYRHEQAMFLDFLAAGLVERKASPWSTGTRSTRPCSPTSR